MSRSIFALKFKQTVGASPIEYLTRWRMLLAGDNLTNSSDPTSSIALSLGYESESASAQPSKGSWAVRHGNIAVAGTRLPLPVAQTKPPAPIGLNLWRVDICAVDGDATMLCYVRILNISYRARGAPGLGRQAEIQRL
ncbi:MAG: hypothetical protein QOJ99_2842 [Bryobacterales bacterium]|nr:hypothetical protein [Bryobacterales bacterium]